MAIPPEVAWIVPVVLPFILGVLVGAAIKKAVKLIVLIIAIVIILVATGILTVTFSSLFSQAMKLLPTLFNLGQAWLNVLPYASVAFLIGVALGFLFSK